MRHHIYFIICLLLTTNIFAYDWSTNPGDGSPENPYQISEPNHLIAIGSDPNLLNKHFILTNDIVFDPNNNPIHVFTQALIAPDISTSYGFQGTAFTGLFDGAGYAIRNFNINAELNESDYLGIFGKIANGAVTKNLGIVNVSIAGAAYSSEVGGLCGYNSYATIQFCYTTGAITGKDHSFNFGGLCGVISYGMIKDSHSSISITTINGGRLYDSGGLCGINNRGSIINCHASGDVIGGTSSEFLGGLCGHNYSDSEEIIDCYATGSISGTYYIGGLCGGGGWKIKNCYATGTITGWRYVGGLCGSSGTIINSYATGNIIGLHDSQYIGGLCGLSGGTIVNCHSSNAITCDDSSSVGGLCGVSYSSISDCYATSTIIGNAWGSVGGICGMNEESGTIKNCYSGSTLTSLDYSGGLCGNNRGLIKNSFAAGTITGNLRNGGLCGENSGGTIIYCYAICDVSGSIELGGFCGLNTGTIEDCYTMGSVYAGEEAYAVGGFCGQNFGYDSDATIMNCYSTNLVTVGLGSTSFGGLCGKNSKGIIENSFWDTETSGLTTSDGGTGLDDPNMMIQVNFVNADWDFLGEEINGENEVWRMCVDSVDYPRLSWEFAQNGDFACDDGVDINDLQVLCEEWLTAADITPTTFNYACDANGDEKIDLADFSVLGANW